MITANNITDAQLAALAKCKAATCMRAGGERLSTEVAKLTYIAGINRRVDPNIILQFENAGLIRWDNGTVITEAGEKLLADAIVLRAAKETK